MSVDPATVRRLYVDGFIALLEARDNVAMGAYAEVLVLAALEGSTGTVHRWDFADVRWRGRSIQVKCSTGHPALRDLTRPPNPARWTAPKRFAVDEAGEWTPHERPLRHVDVYVFMRHEGTEPDVGWTARVVPTRWLDANVSDAGYVSAAGLDAAGWAPVPLADLPAAVEAVPPGDRLHSDAWA